MVVIWFVIVNLFATFSLNRINLLPDTAYSWINPKQFFQNKSINIIDLHCRWDCVWYLDIAQNGYQYRAGELSNIVFFPLYPFLITVGSFITLGNYVLAGWFISMFCLVLASNYLYKLVSKFHTQADSRLTLIFMLIFPTSFFFNAIYTESLFLFLSVACFYYTFSKKYLVASIFGLFAALTRFTGFILFIPIIYEYLESQNFKIHLSFKILPSLLIPFGGLLFPFYHYLAFGDFSLFLKVEALWGRTFVVNNQHFQLDTASAISNFALDFGYVFLIMTALFFVFKRLKTSYGLYMLGTVFIALSTGTFMSIGRYILTLFPLYILFASLKNEYLKLSIAFVSILFLALTIILFVNNYWAG